MDRMTDRLQRPELQDCRWKKQWTTVGTILFDLFPMVPWVREATHIFAVHLDVLHGDFVARIYIYIYIYT